MTNSPKLPKGTLASIDTKEIREIIETGNQNNFRFLVKNILQNGENIEKSTEKMQKLGNYLDKVYFDNFFKKVIKNEQNDNILAGNILKDLVNTGKLNNEDSKIIFKIAIEKVKDNYFWAKDIIQSLINTGKIENETLNNFFTIAINRGKKSDSFIFIILSLINTGKIDSEGIELFNNFFKEIAIKRAENSDYGTRLPDLINTGKIDSEGIELFNNFFKEIAIKRAENSDYGTRLPDLINTGKIDSEGIELFNNFFKEIAIKRAKNSDYYAENILPALINTGKIENETLNNFFTIVIKEAEKSNPWVKYIIPALINTGKIENETLNNFFTIVIKEAEKSNSWVKYIIPALINTGKIDDKGIKLFNNYSKIVIKEAEKSNLWVKYIIPALINTGKIDDEGIKLFNNYFEIAIKEAEKSDFWARKILPDLINTGKIDDKELKKLFKIAVKKDKFNTSWIEYIIPTLINTGKIDDEELKKLFKIAIKEGKFNTSWIEYIIPTLINTGKIDDEELKKLFKITIKRVENNNLWTKYWAKYIIPALINTGKIESKTLNNFFTIAINRAEKRYWAEYIIPALINTGLFDFTEVDKGTKEQYKEEKKLQDKIFELCDYDTNILNFLHNNFLNKKLLTNVADFLENKQNYNFDKKFFIENIDKITKNKYGVYFGYFIEAVNNTIKIENPYIKEYELHFDTKCIISGVRESLQKIIETQERNTFVTLENFTDYIDDENEILFHFKKDNGFSVKKSETIPWTKAWFLEDETRKDLLKPENFKTFQKFGTIIGLGLLEGAKNKEKLNNFYDYMFSVINREKSRPSLLQLAELFNIILKNKNFPLFDELVDKEVNIGEDFEKFSEKNHISDKGRTILTLLIAREIRDSYQIFNDKNGKNQVDFISVKNMLISVYKKFKNYEKLIETYDNEKISIGIEIEVTQSIAKGYKEETGGDYKNDIVIISEYAGIGEGRDAVHEIATKPTNNPYLLLLEVQLLQDLDFLDLNFKKQDYEKGARGLHITLGGVEGIKLDENNHFIQNIVSAGNIGGLNSGEEISQVNKYSNIKQKRYLENIFEEGDYNKKKGVEYRSLSIDNMEQFERMILSMFNLHLGFSDEKIGEEFEKLKKDIEKIINEHNKNFVENETLVGDFPQSLENLFNFQTSSAPSDVLFKKIGVNIYYLQNLFEANIDSETDFVEKINADFENNLTDKQFELLYKRYDLTIKTNLKILKDKNSKIYNNLGSYLNGSIEETKRKITNKKRFVEVIGDDKNYLKSLKISKNDLYKEINTDLVNKFTKINNLFIKKDSTNALSMYDNTIESDGTKNEEFNQKYLTNFELLDKGGKRRKGYNIIQGASEKMLVQAIQKRILEFNDFVEKNKK